MRDGFTIITDDDLHASLQHVRSYGSPHSSSVSRRRDTEGSSSAAPRASQPVDGAAVVSPFNLDACFKIGDGK